MANPEKRTATTKDSKVTKEGPRRSPALRGPFASFASFVFSAVCFPQPLRLVWLLPSRATG